MNTHTAAKAFSAIGQTTRLETLRLLVRQGPNGLAAGDIARHLGVAPSALSHHLNILENAGLIRSWRAARHIFYAVDVEGVRKLTAFLTEDCCHGNPDLCGHLGSATAFCEA